MVAAGTFAVLPRFWTFSHLFEAGRRLAGKSTVSTNESLHELSSVALYIQCALDVEDLYLGGCEMMESRPEPATKRITFTETATWSNAGLTLTTPRKCEI